MSRWSSKEERRLMVQQIQLLPHRMMIKKRKESKVQVHCNEILDS